MTRTSFRYFVTLRGQERIVDLTEDEGGKLAVTLDGTPVDADLIALHDGTLHSLLLDGQSRELVIERDGDRVTVWLDGEKVETLVRDEVSRALASVLKPAAAGPSEVEAPMPGVVVSIPVKVGDVVTQGQPVVVVEAMKMQNELGAETPGIVEEICVRPGQTVDRGDVLARIRGQEAPSEGASPA